ncbi:4-hydroxybenzoate octaprenyltransferase [Candidatus Profftia lariciata]|uniref:4-hydroxybenzoate octaprenyltransferase n=1 Tax=Candidatus Profftia lariciata TaxID=1987921 RepID=UPI001EEF9E4F|nr:4-hydroxybenzoate octaprenyltransferase [Candidatus Profftia lariciata]
MRIDKPIGWMLLLWPTYWALWLASNKIPSIKFLTIFTLGAFLMRSAGCVINDYVDRSIDGYVTRTANRPLPSRIITEKESKILFVILILISFRVVLMLNTMTIVLSFVGLSIAWIYPFMKQLINFPQVILGIAFSWSIPMVYSAVIEILPLSCWLLFLANIVWTIAYDTQYAIIDRNDDLNIGIKSTAILFGRFDILIIGLLQLIMLLLMLWVGYLNHLKIAYYCSIILAGILFLYQQKLLKQRKGILCFKAFLSNNYVGLILFIGIVLSVL